MSNNQNFANLVKLHNSRQKVPVLEITRDRALSAMLSKAVDPTFQTSHTAAGSRKVETPGLGTLHNIASRTANNISHADTTMQMLPDMQLGAQILVSSVASPKDMQTLTLSYQTTPGILPPTVLAAVIGEVKDHFDKVYKIKNSIPRILHEVLFEKGSHIKAIIPENSIDEMINRTNAVSMESFNEALGVIPGSTLENPLTSGLNILGPGLEGYKSLTPTPTRNTNTNVNKTGFTGSPFNIGNENLPNSYNFGGATKHEFSQKMHYDNGGGKFEALENITVTDNPNILRMPMIQEKLRKDQLKAKLQFDINVSAMEAHIGGKIPLDDRSLKNLIYKSRKRGVESMQVFKTDNQLKRRSIGRPLIMELPSESVIPVYTPGQEDRHVGYFILLDQTGNPVKSMNDQDTFGDMQSRLMKASNQTSNIANRLRQLTDGLQCSQQEYTDVMNRVYEDMAEQDLLARLRNGMYANSVALAKNTDFYRVMLSRVFQQQHTTVLFMPADMVTYFARKYNQYGIGVSILDEMKMLNNMRAIAMMSNTILGIKNSIPRTEVALKIDDTDPDPYKTAEMVLNEISRVNQNAVPFGASSPVDIADFLQRSQYRVNITGHPAVPETTIEYTESNTNYSKVDTELDESLQKRALMAMGLTAEHINNGFNQETATSVVANNLMLSRRVMIIQDQINPHITDFHQKVIKADEELREKLIDILFNAYEELEIDEEAIAKEIGNDKSQVKFLVISHILNDFVDGLEVSLPRPNTATIENQKDALEAYSGLLDITIDAYLSEKFFTDELAGEVSREVDSIKEMLKAHFMRAYMAENGIMPELASIVTLTDNDEPEINLWDTQKEHVEKLMKTMSGFMKKIQKTKQESNELVERLNETSGGDGGSSDYSSSSGSDDATSSATDDPFGDPAGDMDFGMDDTGLTEPDAPLPDEPSLDDPKPDGEEEPKVDGE